MMSKPLEDRLFDLYTRTASRPNQLFIKEFRAFVICNQLDVKSKEFKEADRLAVERIKNETN